MTFSANGVSFGNAVIPSAAIPNDIICPFWDDFDLRLNSDNSTGRVFMQLDGAMGSQRLIIQWDNAGYYNVATTPIAHATFQAILYEGSNRIEFRYGAIGPGGTATIGVENGDGTRGDGIGNAANTGPPVGVTSIVFRPVTPCATGCACPGDLNADMLVDSGDIQSLVDCAITGTGSYACADMNGSTGPIDQTDVNLFVTKLLAGNNCQ